MLPSIGLGLLALLRRIRSTGHTLKSFILRCLLCWPHVLRSLRRIWSLCSRRTGASPKDLPKDKGGQARPLTPGASSVCEGYSAIHASLDFNGASEPVLPSGPGNTEGFPLSPTIGRPQSAPRSSTPSFASSLHGSPQRSDRRLSGGSTLSITSSHIANSVHSRTRQLTIRHVNTPLTLTHSRVTSRQFAGALSRSRSPSPILFPTPHLFPSPSLSRSSSPSTSLPPHPLPLSTIPDNPVSTRISDVVQDTPEGSRRSSFDITIFPPSRSQTLSTTLESPQSPLSSQQGHVPLTYANAHHSSGSLSADVRTPSPNRAIYPPSFPQPSTSRVSIIHVPVADASSIPSDGGTRDIRLMTSEQVSRYLNKGDV